MSRPYYLADDDQQDNPFADADQDAGGPPSDDQLFQQVLGLLRQRGIALPDGTTPDNLVQRLSVALHALTHAPKGGGKPIATSVNGISIDPGTREAGVALSCAPASLPILSMARRAAARLHGGGAAASGAVPGRKAAKARRSGGVMSDREVAELAAARAAALSTGA